MHTHAARCRADRRSGSPRPVTRPRKRHELQFELALLELERSRRELERASLDRRLAEADARLRELDLRMRARQRELGGLAERRG